MTKIEDLLIGYNTFEKRSALYYLTRYIKQAETFENYKKDIFEDEIYSQPSEDIKSLTLKMIDFIEEIQRKKAADFSEDEFYFWMDKIAELEDSIDERPSKELVQKALDELTKFTPPKANNSD